MRLGLRVVALAALLLLASGGRAQAQLGSLISPGKLAKAHGALEGLGNCQKCHEQGRKVTADKCLACHQPVAQRMARKVGVHAKVTTECATCHADHAGVAGQLRPFDEKGFDHAGVAGFPLTGKHAPLVGQCAACHKTRSFLTASAACSACHMDVHKGRFGANCATCHSTDIAFKATAVSDIAKHFDHNKAAFRLTGAHAAVACVRCHANNTFKGVKFASCADCHKDPHRPAQVTASAGCASCHTSTATWKTPKVDHARTAYPLLGRHAKVDCAACHKQPAMKVKPASATCATCHVDVHRGTFKQDCKACHSENGFTNAPFNHATTKFALVGKHEALACVACHKTAAPGARGASARSADFRGLSGTCVSCHADVHQNALGTACESCHSATTFKVTSFSHPRLPEFFAGGHARVVCDKCHVPEAPGRPVRPGPKVLNVKFKNVATTCVTCHADVHQNALGKACESCHSPETFRVTSFKHPRFPEFFAGQHATVACNGCHVPARPAPRSTRTTAAVLNVPFKDVATTCVSCHKDVHLGQVGSDCAGCHSVQGAKFALAGFSHAKTAFALTGRHDAVECVRCHPRTTGVFPSGTGSAVKLKGVPKDCQGCHADVHAGQLTGTCDSCHSSTSFRVASYTHRDRALSGFFVGRHAKATCQACHKTVTGQFPAGRATAIKFQVGSQCVSCHTDIHRGALGPRCADCHKP